MLNMNASSRPLDLEQELNAARRHISDGRLSPARQICENILSDGHDSVEALYLLAVAAYCAGDDEEVADLLRRAVARYSDNERFLAMLGGYCLSRHRYAEALEWFRRAARLHPDSVGAVRAQGQTLAAMGRLNEAEAAYRDVLDTAPEDREALCNLAKILLRRGKPVDAAYLLEQVLSRHREDAVALARLGACEATRGRREEARRLLLAAIARDPEHPEAYKTLADLDYGDGRLEEATDNLQKHLEHGHSLCKLATTFRTDKWGIHHYARHYHKHFFPLRNREVNLLEIGVGGYNHPLRGGASLRMWKAFFPKGNIFGIDIHDKSALEEERIRIFQGSQADAEFLRGVAADIGRIDILIDDGSHVNRHVVDTFKTLFPLIADDGIYAVEDTQTSYWPKFGGDSTDLNHPDSMLTFFKGLTDGLNYEELLLPGYSPDYFERHVTAMHFYHNLIFIYKGENREGSNFVKDGVLQLK